MTHYTRKNNTAISILNNSFIDLPAMSNLSNLWNFGSLLGIMLMSQLISGIFLAMNYTNNVGLSFLSLSHLIHDVNSGWLLRLIHANGSSFFFLLIFLHIGRNIYFNSFNSKSTWNSGILILFLSMAIAFFGYVLPWGQMSFWGATVITNLLSAIPVWGKTLVVWVWGGFSVNNNTLTRFFSLHFTLPFLLIFLIVIHLMFLHDNKSSNPMGINHSIDKIPFFPYFVFKDLFSMMLTMTMFFGFNFFCPYLVMDNENFSLADPLVTPSHIQPEWYFLFAYTILRSVPNKLGGVTALVLSIGIFFLMTLKPSQKQYSEGGVKFISFWLFTSCFILLTWLGMKAVEYPFSVVASLLSIFYFLIIFYWLLTN